MSKSVSQSQTRFMYVSSLYKEKNRLRPLPLPSELSKRIRELEKRAILMVGYELDKELRVSLPWLVVKEMKRYLLNADDKEIREYLAFVAYDFGNIILRMVLPSVPSIILRDPEELKIDDKEIEFSTGKIKVRSIRASSFWIYPPERVSNSIELNAVLYNIPDELDVYNYSKAILIIDLRKLLDEINIRWDLSR